jgi:Hint domain
MGADKNPPAGLTTSRRNLARMSALVGVAMVAKAAPAAAGPFHWLAELFGFGGHRRTPQDSHFQMGLGTQQGLATQPDSRCFLKGTKIRTVLGEKTIEDLTVGDVLPTVFGATCPVQWIGSYRFKRTDSTREWVKDVLPVRITRSAISAELPHADLYVTEQHALLIDGVLVAAGNLINGMTITRYGACELDELEYFHIKLERHDVIYAEGAPCETLLDVDESATNFAEYMRQYGSFATETTPCAPLFRYRYRRGEVKSCFRSAISPWIDRRQTVDLIRDKLEERAIALSRESELIT